MKQDLFKNYNYLSFNNPFYFIKNREFKINGVLSNLIKDKKDRIKLDNSAIIEILTKDYILGDRTIIKEIFKTPWMAKPNKENTKWDYFKKLEFNNLELSKSEISKKLFHLLKEEVLNQVQDKKSVGILLSGGMDSRIVAGVLDSLIKNNEIEGVRVKAFTWGKKNSRDVVYAKRIADRLKWDWMHLELTSEDLFLNIKETAIRGCEFSPIHLHAMMKIREEKGVDCILAGSFGDSMGRGEYSGKIITKLNDIRSGINNKDGIFKKGIVKKYFSQIDSDILMYRNIFPQNKIHQQIEQDYQIHYWRRMLNPCMSVINEKIPLYQLFTSPELVKFIWSLDPLYRNNEIYNELLLEFNNDMTDIPWARTGLEFDRTEGITDTYDKNHYSYSNMIKTDLYDYIKDLVISENIASLNLFNMKTLVCIFKLMKTPLYYKDIVLESKLIWLASLSLFIDLSNIELDKMDYNKYCMYDSLNMLLPLKKNILRKVKFSLTV